MRLLGLSGSVRQASTNRALLVALAACAPDGVTLEISDLIGDLPIFNPDHEGALTPPSVEAFATSIRAADGLVIACPEYAHGIPGGLKNALDWLVSRDEIPGKPAMLVRASTRSDFAHDALMEVLRTMSVRVMPEAGFAMHLMSRSPAQIAALLGGAEARIQLRAALERFAAFAG